MVRLPHPGPDETWETAPPPSLVVEVASDRTRRRDRIDKRAVYVMEARIPTYWIVDARPRSIRVLRPNQDEVVLDDTIEWWPSGASAPLTFGISRVFRD